MPRNSQDQTFPNTATFVDAFPDKLIPDNSDIDKGKTGFGITYSEFHAERHSILVIPSVAIIDDKFEDYHDLSRFKVEDRVTPKMVSEYLFSDADHKNIITTPESFWKIIDAAGDKLHWLYDTFFCFLDESHCYATEAFREDILTPFEWFFSFKRKAMGSATPFPYTDPRFNELTKYKIRFEDKFGTINIIHNERPKDVLNTMLRQPDMFPGNVHIFFNTVTQSGDAILSSGIKNVNIYCRDDEKNLVNLGDACVHFKHKPTTGDYRKFNFYSCRYNEGWDLRDSELATIILVTDVKVPHSLIGIPFKGFQAVGRLRDHKPHKIYHITNTHDKLEVKTFDKIKTDCYNAAESHIAYHNSFLKSCEANGYDSMDTSNSLVKPFADLNKSNLATINHMKVSQVICTRWCNEHYNNIGAIERSWQDCNYNTQIQEFDLMPIKRCRKSTAEKYKQVVTQLEELKANPDKYVFSQTTRTLNSLKEDYPVLFQAMNLIGIDKIKEMNYDKDKLKAALIEMSNNNAEAQLRIRIAKTFLHTERYTKKFIKQKLQEFYDELGIKKPNGTRKIANAEQLDDFGMFKLKEGKAEDENGKLKPAFIIEAVYHTLKVAA